MKNELATQKISPDIIQKLVLDGDLSKMSQDQKVSYYNNFCQSLGLNPLTQPFQLITFQGKQRLYATKDCTEQLRKLHGVSITDITATKIEDVYVVTAKAQDREGKTDCATGAVPILNVKGDALANALMKAETKAKRRVTLSICGLGLLDESETDTMKGAVTQDIVHEEVKTAVKNDMQSIVEGAATELLDTQIEREQWETVLSECQDEAGLVKIYKSNKAVVDGSAELKNLFSTRKNQLRHVTA